MQRLLTTLPLHRSYIMYGGELNQFTLSRYLTLSVTTVRTVEIPKLHIKSKASNSMESPNT